MNNILTIEQCENGWILSSEDEIEDGKFETVKELIEEKNGEREGIVKLLTKVAEFFGENYDKYRNENLRISWDLKGHKVD